MELRGKSGGIVHSPSVIQALALTLLLAHTAAGQSSATITGRVTDKASGKPLRAQILLVNTTRSVNTDTTGHFELSAIAAGQVTIQARSLGFSASTFTVQLTAGQRLTHEIALDSIAGPQALPTVDVVASAATMSYRLVGFERRRQTGRGQYMTEADIKRIGAGSVPEAVRGLRGVVFECGGGAGCYIRMSRAPMRCLPEYIVDEQVMNDFGARTPIGDVVAIEVYNGPGDVAGEFAGRHAGCGVIVIWTRTGPPKRRN